MAKSLVVTERDLIHEIGRRAERRMRELDMSIDQMTVVMDITCVHLNHPLRLQELLDADDMNFMHDVLGINRHLNRWTQKLENCFVPRFSTN